MDLIDCLFTGLEKGLQEASGSTHLVFYVVKESSLLNQAKKHVILKLKLSQTHTDNFTALNKITQYT